jgi:hypothetical protein
MVNINSKSAFLPVGDPFMLREMCKILGRLKRYELFIKSYKHKISQEMYTFATDSDPSSVQ